MKFHSRILSFALIIIPLTNLFAQIVIPKGYFASPLNIGLSVNGSFAEIRSNHFHSGIDFPVQQKEGLPVFAVADGVISRIKVSPVGFGNALYIDHPNGFTSVYAHLQKYSDTIAQYIHANQYRVKSFDVDLFPMNRKEFIRVTKGQLIGYAGNSGSSGGPHLHFELRNTKTERVINPMHFELGITDNYPPYIDFIKIYPENENSLIGSSNEATRFNVKKTGTREYRLATKDTLALQGSFSMGVQAFDFHHNQSNRNGFYSIKMFADEVGFFSMVCDSFSFAESRYINASIDYAANYNSGNRIVKSKKLPGNQLSFFKTDKSDGVLTFTDEKVHEIRIIVGDLAENEITLRFWVKSYKPEGYVQVPAIPDADTAVFFKYNKMNAFENKDMKVELPTGSLYEDLVFRYRSAPREKGMFSDIHYLHNAEVPIHNRIKVSVKAYDLKQSLRAKALLVRVDRDGKRSSAGGSYENGFVTATVNVFDGYAIVIDTLAPVIKPYSGNANSKSSLRFTVSDNFSGISNYYGEVNGKWALVEWDPKNKLMIYRFDEITQPGKNEFILYLEDEKGNKSKYATTFSK
jgi:hypothetical protein